MRDAPQNRMVTLIEMPPSSSPFKASANSSSRTMALVKCGTLCVERIERIQEEVIWLASRFRKKRMCHDDVDRRGTGGGQRLGAGDNGAAGRDDVVDDQGGAAGDARPVRKFDRDRAIPAAGLSRDGRGQAEPAGEVADPGSDSASGPPRRSLDQARFCATCRIWPAWPRDCRLRCREIPL